MRLPQDATPDMVEDLEGQLRRSLRRVEPRQEFVGNLYDRLVTPPAMTVERRTNTAYGMLLAACSLLSGVILIWVLRQFRTG